ncbi:MAG TPA: hypothetical protein VK658_14880 [Chryseolinea sp.]|nr:hypothetical protein [Chryseolinea sp.]
MWVNIVCSIAGGLVATAFWIHSNRQYARMAKMKFREYETMLSEQMQDYESLLEEQFKVLVEKEEMINEKTAALRELYYLMHHTRARPAMASGLGLLGLYWQDSKTLDANLKLLAKPNHHGYAAIADQVKERMDDYVQKIETICKTLYQSSIEPGKKFEHLQ